MTPFTEINLPGWEAQQAAWKAYTPPPCEYDKLDHYATNYFMNDELRRFFLSFGLTPNRVKLFTCKAGIRSSIHVDVNTGALIGGVYGIRGESELISPEKLTIQLLRDRYINKVAVNIPINVDSMSSMQFFHRPVVGFFFVNGQAHVAPYSEDILDQSPLFSDVRRFRNSVSMSWQRDNAWTPDSIAAIQGPTIVDTSCWHRIDNSLVSTNRTICTIRFSETHLTYADVRERLKSFIKS